MPDTMPARERGLRLAEALDSPHDLERRFSHAHGLRFRDETATSDGSWAVEGYAAVYEQSTVLYESRGYRMREEIARGAFDNVLERLANGNGRVHLNLGHDSKQSLASTKRTPDRVGGLELRTDDHGLHFFARIDKRSKVAQELAVQMQNEVYDEASFAFTIARETLAGDLDAEDGKIEELWRIEEVGELYDVCVCAQGAYPQTESFIRARLGASLHRGPSGSGDAESHRERVSGGSQTIVASTVAEMAEAAGVVDPVLERKLAHLRARSRALTITLT